MVTGIGATDIMGTDWGWGWGIQPSWEVTGIGTTIGVEEGVGKTEGATGVGIPGIEVVGTTETGAGIAVVGIPGMTATGATGAMEVGVGVGVGVIPGIAPIHSAEGRTEGVEAVVFVARFTGISTLPSSSSLSIIQSQHS